MFKKSLVLLVLAATGGALVFGVVNSAEARGGYGATASADSGNGVQQRGNVGRAPLVSTTLASSALDADEAAALLYMREEEKLAHDVYVALYTRWGLSVFQNISQSEQTHSDAILTLLNRYGLADPASSQPGVFTNPDLQALYTRLIAQGGASLADALWVGALIEETDIVDLTTRLDQTDKADIQQVFNNLLRGSGNHLRAFTTALNAQTGAVYAPQIMSDAAYQAIVSQGWTTGGAGQGLGGQSGYRGERS